MAYCPRCGHDLSASDAGPRFPEELVEAPGCHWVPVARIAGLAEAGFLQDLLQERDIPSRARQWDDFSAVDGSWSTVYIMQVPAEYARAAATAIQEGLSAADAAPAERAEEEVTGGRSGLAGLSRQGISARRSARRMPESDAGGTASDQGSGGFRWIAPLLAGAAAFSVGYVTRQPERRPAQPPIRHTVRKAELQRGHPLPGHAGRRSKPMRQQDEAAGALWPGDVRGRPQFRFRRDRANGRLVVEEDRDGDGRFERQRTFRWNEFEARPSER